MNEINQFFLLIAGAVVCFVGYMVFGLISLIADFLAEVFSYLALLCTVIIVILIAAHVLF